jgi:hypothetical protein
MGRRSEPISMSWCDSYPSVSLSKPAPVREHASPSVPDTTGRRNWKLLFAADAAWFAVSAAVAFLVGLAGDQFFRATPLGLRYETPAQRLASSLGGGEATLASINLVTLEEVEILLARKDVIVLDARPRVFHELGRLPGARSLSREQFEEDFSALETDLPVRERTLLIYCSDAGCEDSVLV